jgi:beta-glucuronidase
MLKPIENDVRERKSLGGLWRFCVDTDGLGHGQAWWQASLAQSGATVRDIAVPASYNDLFPDAAVRDHVGDVWYQELGSINVWCCALMLLRTAPRCGWTMWS